MRKSTLLWVPALIALAVMVNVALFPPAAALPGPLPRRPAEPVAAVEVQPAAPEPRQAGPAPAAPATAERAWKKEPDRARRRWAKALVEQAPTLTRDELMVELARIEGLPDGDERIDAVRALFGSDQIDRSATDRLLALYDRSTPGDFRKVLFGALLFSSAGDYVAEQMLFRTRTQDPEVRDYTYVADLTSRHAEAWELLCDSVPACRGEEAACRAALAVAGMSADYPAGADAVAQAQRLRSMISQTTWPAARIYLYQALLTSPGSEGLDGARVALQQERDEEVRRAVLKMRPGLDRK